MIIASNDKNGGTIFREVDDNLKLREIIIEGVTYYQTLEPLSNLREMGEICISKEEIENFYYLELRYCCNRYYAMKCRSFTTLSIYDFENSYWFPKCESSHYYLRQGDNNNPVIIKVKSVRYNYKLNEEECTPDKKSVEAYKNPIIVIAKQYQSGQIKLWGINNKNDFLEEKIIDGNLYYQKVPQLQFFEKEGFLYPKYHHLETVDFMMRTECGERYYIVDKDANGSIKRIYNYTTGMWYESQYDHIIVKTGLYEHKGQFVCDVNKNKRIKKIYFLERNTSIEPYDYFEVILRGNVILDKDKYGITKMIFNLYKKKWENPDEKGTPPKWYKKKKW